MNQRLILAAKKNPSSRFHQSKARKTISAVLEALLSLSTRYHLNIGSLMDLQKLREKYRQGGGQLSDNQDVFFQNYMEEIEARLAKVQGPFRMGHIKPISSLYRMIWDTTNSTQKKNQQYWARRLGSIQAHRNTWGFCRGRSCLDACQSHLTYWGIQRPGELSFFAMDLENFFPSITGDMVELAMIAHSFKEEEISDCVDDCTFMVTVRFYDYVQEIIHKVFGVGETAPMDNRFIAEFQRIVALINGTYSAVGPTTSMYQVHPFGMMDLHGEPFNPKIVAFARELFFRFILGFNPACTFGSRILIQGSPASPAISNLVAKRMDYRLTAFAKATGLFYGRYADDLCFSWKRRRTPKNINLLIYSVAKIVKDCGFHVRSDKTIIKGPGMQQSMLGYNLNAGKITVSRGRRDKVRKFLEKAATVREMDLQEFSSIMGEVEFIATAHPELASELRRLGNRVIGNLEREVKCKAIDLGQSDDIEVVGIKPRKIALW